MFWEGFNEVKDMAYWPKGALRPLANPSDADQIFAYASCGLTFLGYRTAEYDDAMTLYCAYCILAYEVGQ